MKPLTLYPFPQAPPAYRRWTKKSACPWFFGPPKGSKNRSKIDESSNIIFHRFWPPTWPQNPPKIEPKRLSDASWNASCFSNAIFDLFSIILGLSWPLFSLPLALRSSRFRALLLLFFQVLKNARTVGERFFSSFRTSWFYCYLLLFGHQNSLKMYLHFRLAHDGVFLWFWPPKRGQTPPKIHPKKPPTASWNAALF